MNISFLLIGGNEGDRKVELAKACVHIEQAGWIILRRSSLFETAAWGKEDQASFLNQALQVEGETDGPRLMDVLLGIEEKMGRRRLEKYGSRNIDIDMLFFNSAVIHSPRLTVPHPQIQNRRFALAPMEEIAPDFIHPVLHKSIRELLAVCPDKLEVKKIINTP
ncbi:MAG: 2-amino-4-hydroxy-6-hydroxymethyldihydropteridine diphosphokinase [Bacteroidota bacterium]